MLTSCTHQCTASDGLHIQHIWWWQNPAETRSIFANCVCLACIVVVFCVIVVSYVFVAPYAYLLYLMCICCTLCVFVVLYVYLLHYVCIAAPTLDAGLLARSQYPEGPATGHLDTGFSWFPCVYKRMLRWFPSFQVATTCLSCSPPT